MKLFVTPTPVVRPFREAPPQHDPVVKEIRSLAHGSVYIGALSIVFLGVVFGPLALYCARRALRLLKENGYWGAEHKFAAYTGCVLGSSGTALWGYLLVSLIANVPG